MLIIMKLFYQRNNRVFEFTSIFFRKTLCEGDEIILTEMEHHSNLVPWQQIALEKKCILKFIPVNAEGRVDLNVARNMITKKTKIVSVTMSQMLWGRLPFERIRSIDA